MKGYRCTKIHHDPEYDFGNKYFWLFPNKDTALFMGNIKGTNKNAVREKCRKIK